MGQRPGVSAGDEATVLVAECIGAPSSHLLPGYLLQPTSSSGTI